MRGDSGVADEGRVVGVSKFHSWGKCIMPLTNINSDWMSNASSGLCIILLYCYIILLYYIILYYIILYYLRGSFKLHLGGVITSMQGRAFAHLQYKWLKRYMWLFITNLKK